MAILPPIARPTVLWAELRSLWGADRRHKLVFAALAVGATSFLITLFVLDGKSGIKPPPSIIYAADWSNSRTDAEIKAQQRIDQAAKDKADAEKRAAYQRLARQLHIE